MIKKLIFIALLSLILPLFVVSPIFAQQQVTGENVVLPREETVNQDFFVSGGSVTLAGTVNGDAFVAGGTVVVEGTVNGDLLVAGGTVDIRGRVTEDIRAIGGQVNISGQIGGNVSTAGGTVNLTNSANITGSFSDVSGNLSVFAPIGGGVTFTAGQATLGSNIGGNVLGRVGQLTLTPQAQIAGDLTYVSTTQAQISPSAQVAGQIIQRQPAQPAVEPVEFLATVNLIATLASFLAALIIGLLLLYFFPGFALAVTDKIQNRPWFSLLIGFLTIILFPIIFVILLITLIGIPLALILLAVFLILLYLAKIFVSIFIGQIIFRAFGWKTAAYWALILGLIIYELITLIPIIGWIFAFFVVLFGLGAALLTKKDYYDKLRSKESI